MSSAERVHGLKVDHIGIAVEALDDAVDIFEKKLGGQSLYRSESQEQGMVSAKMQLGEVEFELMEPISPEGPVGKFVAKKGPGVHHVSIRVSELDHTIEALKETGVGVGRIFRGEGYRVAFIHPKDALGVLIELIERTGSS